MQEQLLPFLKWAGGKRWLASNHAHLFPKIEGRLIEPFAGSAAVFFNLRPKSAILADSNARLIETYQAIRENPDRFQFHLKEFARTHSKDFYYEVRNRKFRSVTRRAAHFVYLNRVCFNGIYRENLNGIFNVPLGSKTQVLLDTDDFQAVSKLLQRAIIIHSDFEPVIDRAKAKDFLFVDPPYTTKHNLNGFVKYNQRIFSWDDQERLAASLKRANERGVSILVSNANHADVRCLYEPFLDVRSIERHTVIASRAENRGKTTEMVACNVF